MSRDRSLLHHTGRSKERQLTGLFTSLKILTYSQVRVLCWRCSSAERLPGADMRGRHRKCKNAPGLGIVREATLIAPQAVVLQKVCAPCSFAASRSYTYPCQEARRWCRRNGIVSYLQSLTAWIRYLSNSSDESGSLLRKTARASNIVEGKCVFPQS